LYAKKHTIVGFLVIFYGFLAYKLIYQHILRNDGNMSTPVKFEMDPDILEACKRYIEIGEFESLSDIVSYCLR